MIEKRVEIQTADGTMTTFICHPERHGPHPLIIFFMDAPGIREELRDMARRYASVGYYVMLPNLYYRHGVLELGPLPASDDTEGLARITSFVQATTTDRVMGDTDALVTFAQTDASARIDRIGTVGYCLSGQFAVGAAARYPDRVVAAASIYGTWLFTDQADSPHLLARKAKAEMYFACAEIDHWMPIDQSRLFARDLHNAGVDAEVEFYAKQEHGFAFPSRPAFDKTSAERHWERVLSLFGRNVAAPRQS